MVRFLPNICFSQVYFFRSFLELYVHVIICSVMSGRFPVFIGRTSSKQWITCFAEGHNSDCTSGEHRTSISSIPSLTLLKVAFLLFSSFAGTVECADVVSK